MLKHICMNLNFHEYAWICIIVCDVQLLQKIIFCDQLMGPPVLHALVMRGLCPVILSTLRFLTKEQPKKGKRVNTSQDYILHIRIAMYYTPVSNLYSVVELVVGCSISCCCPAKNHCLTSVPLHYHIIKLFLPSWSISFEIPHFLIGTGGWAASVL